jgi:hypothetical protein
MNKAIIVEVNSRHLIVLAEGGEFTKIKNPHTNHQVGQEITLPLKESRSFLFPSLFNWKTGSAVALAIILLFFQIFSPISGQGVYAYVGMDMDPSLELKIDENMNVLNILSFNEEGKDVLKHLQNWKNKDITIVTNDIFEISKKLGFLESDEEVLITTTLSEDIPEEKEQEMKERVNELMNKTAKAKSVEMTTIVISSKEREKAKKMNISPGQYAIYSAAKKSGIPITKKEITGKTLEEISAKVGPIKELLAGNSEITEATEKKSEQLYEPPIPILDQKDVAEVNEDPRKVNAIPVKTEKTVIEVPLAVSASPKKERESERSNKQEKEITKSPAIKIPEKAAPAAISEKAAEEIVKTDKPKTELPKEETKEDPKEEAVPPVTETEKKTEEKDSDSDSEKGKWINIEILINGIKVTLTVKADTNIQGDELMKTAAALLNQNVLSMNASSFSTGENEQADQMNKDLNDERPSDTIEEVQQSTSDINNTQTTEPQAS